MELIAKEQGISKYEKYVIFASRITNCCRPGRSKGSISSLSKCAVLIRHVLAYILNISFATLYTHNPSPVSALPYTNTHTHTELNLIHCTHTHIIIIYRVYLHNGRTRDRAVPLGRRRLLYVKTRGGRRAHEES